MNRIIANLKAKYVLKRNGSKNNFLNVLNFFLILLYGSLYYSGLATFSHALVYILLQSYFG